MTAKATSRPFKIPGNLTTTYGPDGLANAKTQSSPDTGVHDRDLRQRGKPQDKDRRTGQDDNVQLRRPEPPHVDQLSDRHGYDVRVRRAAAVRMQEASAS